MIYLDNAATTPLYPEVKQVMKEYLEQNEFGNPSSIHRLGRKAKGIIENAREVIAHSINANPGEIIFTGSGTESINSAILGYAFANRDRGRHMITTAIEHHAVLHTFEYLEKLGWQVTYLPVNHEGLIDVQAVQDALREDTVLVSVMYANNEVGSIMPIEQIANVTYDKGIAFHSDIVQAYGKLPVDVKKVPIDMLSASAHKIHGPKGIGMLYLRNKLTWHPYLHGGKQERGRRAGTENVLGIVGFAKAAEIINRLKVEDPNHLAKLKKIFIEEIANRLPENSWAVNGMENGLETIVNISFLGVDAESLLISLDLASIACSHGSACTSGSLEPSHVLKAMNLGDDRISSAIRFSFGDLTTIDEVSSAAEQVATIVTRMQKT